MDLLNLLLDKAGKNIIYVFVILALIIIKLVSTLSPIKSIPGSKVKHILSTKEWDEIVVKADRVVIVDFFANWCGPCRTCAPYFDYFSQKYDEGKVIFCKVDVDQLSNIARDFGVNQMPCFIIFQDGKIIGRVLGWSDFNLTNYMKSCGLDELSIAMQVKSRESEAVKNAEMKKDE